jgi:alcohol dehydrogenase (NADP+)
LGGKLPPQELIPHTRIKIEVNQVERHPLLQQNALLEYCATQGIHVTGYCPLGSSDRPAFLVAADAPTLLDTPEIRSIAEARGCTPAQVVLAWQVQQGVSVVPKSVTPARIAENFAASEIELSKAELERIAGLDRGYRMISGDIWIKPGAPWTFQTIWDEG